jgi:uncharacterized protein YceH (UPF0502 family)/ketosteroid isomerase-like protein
VDADAVELRVLGCLIEKQRTTPDAYPLSLNALRLACNQSTNRDPVVEYDEPTIRAALERLSLKGWVRLASGRGSRAIKYRHLFDEALRLSDDEIALLAVLMLRGPQTLGELRTRTERLHGFASQDDLEDALRRLIDRELAARIPRRPGQKEDRYAQLVGAEDVIAVPEDARDNLGAVRSLHGGDTGLLERATLFDLVSPEVDWVVAGQPDVLPWAGTWRGPDGVRRWLETLDEHMEYERFEPVELHAAGDTVVEVVSAGGRARASGRPFESEVVRMWTFRAGKAVRVRSYYDTAAYARALRP